jgi:hypothetical protein
MTGFIAAAAPGLEVPISFEGYVFLNVATDFNGGILEMYARRGGEFVPGLTVKLEDKAAIYARNGYHCRYQGLRPRAGSTLTVTIQKGPRPALRPEVLRVTGTVPPLLAITSPRSEATVAAAGAPALDVVWKGDHPPYTLVIREVGSRSSVLREEGLAGTRYSVPMRIFAPGRKYMLQLLGSDHAMRFSSLVPAGSTFKLAQYHSIIIAIE